MSLFINVSYGGTAVAIASVTYLYLDFKSAVEQTPVDNETPCDDIVLKTITKEQMSVLQANGVNFTCS